MYPVIAGDTLTGGVQLMFWAFTVVIALASYMMTVRA
jgi:hypothetical protein